jgi:predicted amidohydrolase YtcJ
MHLPFLSLYNSNRGTVRLRINYLHDDSNTTLPGVTARLQHSYPFFGNAMVRTGGIGEFAVSLDAYAGGEVFEAAAARIAAAGWRLEVHSLTADDFKTQIEGFERVDAKVEGGIKGLRWVVAHVPRITQEYLARLKALGGGVNVSGWMYLSGAGAGNESNPAGPPFKTIVESGIPAGFGPDGANIAPLSPWPHAYYAVTGRNARGVVINPGQGIPRQKVLEMFTRNNTWFLGGPDEKVLGVLEVGRLGDVAVLSDDFFAVEEEQLKRLHSVLTVVGGVVVHDSGELRD